MYPGQLDGNNFRKRDAGNRLCLSANRNYLFPIRTRKTTSLGVVGEGFRGFRTVVKFEKIITTVESTILV